MSWVISYIIGAIAQLSVIIPTPAGNGSVVENRAGVETPYGYLDCMSPGA